MLGVSLADKVVGRQDPAQRLHPRIADLSADGHVARLATRQRLIPPPAHDHALVDERQAAVLSADGEGLGLTG